MSENVLSWTRWIPDLFCKSNVQMLHSQSGSQEVQWSKEAGDMSQAPE